MGRPSLASERTEQILDAFEECIRKYGLKESSIPKIADEAGIKHSLIRHYIGNRDSLVSAMVNRFTDRYLEIISEALSSRISGIPFESTVDYFFGKIARHHAENSIFTELFAASVRDGFIKKQLCSLYGRITDMIAAGISEEYPETGKTRATSLSYSLLSIWIGHSILLHIDFMENGIEMASTAAKKIIGDPETDFRPAT